MNMLAVLDFEATCADLHADPTWDSSQQEIIELPVALVSIAERRVVDMFETLVRPSHQPILTAFCTRLTSIQQQDLEDKPLIAEAMSRLCSWLDDWGVTAENTCAVTCGDWDLRRMWPLQVSLVPGLPMPPLFRSWANLKIAFAAHTGMRFKGMMGMLQRLGLAHEGTHHRGIDDVKNLCRIVIHLLEGGVQITPTWGERERMAERAIYERKLREVIDAEQAKRNAIAQLPTSVPLPVRYKAEEQLRRLSLQVERLREYVRVFS